MQMFTPAAREWFLRTYGAPTPAQSQGWEAIARGEHVLVSSPTGTGKTLTAFLYCLDQLARQPLSDETHILYVSPLKALGNDIRENLQIPLQGLGLENTVRTAVRTGDTPPAQRHRMAKQPPHILITTPESLFLMLSSASGRRILRTARTVILDELHAVAGTKRGAHLMASLERLDHLCQHPLQRIALSATIRPLSLAADFFTGGRGATVVAPMVEKQTEICVDLPGDPPGAVTDGGFWAAMSDTARKLSQPVRTTLAFTEGRAAAERLAFGINCLGEEMHYARTHHGCVSKEQRAEAEEQLRRGELKLLCATSSMELGIDVGEIDLVLQVGAAASVSGLIQRSGRSGHAPGRVSRLMAYPKTQSETLLLALEAIAARAVEIEPLRCVEGCLDVLCQQLMSMALEGEWTPEEALSLLQGAWPFRQIALSDVRSCLEMLSGDWEHRQDKPARPRLLYDRLHNRFYGDSYTRMLVCSQPGVIPDRGWYPVFNLDTGARLGELDEEFVFEARINDVFLLGAFAWRIREILKDRVMVSAAPPQGAQSPFWRGDGRGREMVTGLYYGQLLRAWQSDMRRGADPFADHESAMRLPARQAARDFLARQLHANGCLADDRTMVFEHFQDEAGDHQLMIHSVFGRRVNRALAILWRETARKRTGCDVRSYDDDDGVLLYLMGGEEIPDGLAHSVYPQEAAAMLTAVLPREPMFSMAFRYAAGRALMMGVRRGSRVPLWVQRLRGAEALSLAAEDAAHPLMREASRECLTDLLDAPGTEDVLEKIHSGQIQIREIHHITPSPMALPLRRQAESELLYEYTPIPTAAHRAARERLDQLAPDSDLLHEIHLSVPATADALHSALLSRGDADEDDYPGAPFPDLAQEGRCARLQGLWIAEEERSLYQAAMHALDLVAQKRILRRRLRFFGAQPADALRTRYGFDPEPALTALVQDGLIARMGNEYVHGDALEFARRATIQRRRQEVQTVPARHYAALRARTLLHTLPPEEAMERALAELEGRWAELSVWQDIWLPARVPGYRERMLSDALASGLTAWRIRMEDGKVQITFLPPEQLDEGEFVPAPEAISPLGAQILTVLEAGGAMFEHTVSARLGHVPVTAELAQLARMGLVRCDSLTPLTEKKTEKKISARPRTYGRWERARIPAPRSDEAALETLFQQETILCRETCRYMSFAQALESLRPMEDQGRVRRGYFVKGLGGAQFVDSQSFESVSAALGTGDTAWVCVNAADPACAWGRVLPHEPGREFTLLPGTAICMQGGQVAALWEKRGEKLRIWEAEQALPAVQTFARAFREGRIFPRRSRVEIKSGAEGLEDALLKAGFVAEGLYYVLYK